MDTEVSSSGCVIAVDSGGTFTDCVVIDQSGWVARAKAPSTPEDFSIGVLAAVDRVAEDMGTTQRDLLASCVLFAHGTTVATNALLTRNGMTTGLITTIGHEDVLLIGRTDQKVAGLNQTAVADVARLNKAEPLVPASRTVGVQERIDSRGNVVCRLDLDSVRSAVEQLRNHNVESIAVSLLWSFKHPAHESQIRDLIEAMDPTVKVCLSHEVSPVLGEYERTAATVINAYLIGRTERYLFRLQQRLSEGGLTSKPVVMQSAGGVVAMDGAGTKPVNLLTSGPAGGVMGARYLAELLGYPNVVTTDVGGTSFDVGLVVGGRPQIAETTVFDKYRLALPIIDVATVGAGGGSIAWVEEDTSILRVGPQSAGADPGPACYGLGGEGATVTDANIVLGRISPGSFLGGRRPLDAELADRAVAKVASALGMGVAETAMGIVDVADAHMADLVRKATVERGHDPKEFVLFAFGGAGPMHAASYGPGAGCDRILVPFAASEFSAFGIAGSDLVVVEEFSEPLSGPFHPDDLAKTFATLESRVLERLRENAMGSGRSELRRSIKLRYRGQVNEVETPISAGEISATTVEKMIEDFKTCYEERYGAGTTSDAADLEAITMRVQGRDRLPRPPLANSAGAEAFTADPSATRPVYFRESGGFSDVPLYRFDKLEPGAELAGPALVEADDTTVVVHPAQTCRMDSYRNLLIVPAAEA